MKKNRYGKAWESMTRLRNKPIQVARDIFYIHSQLAIESQLVGESNYLTRFAQLFTIPRVRRANLAAFTVMIAQQMCGEHRPSRWPPVISRSSGCRMGRDQYHCILFHHGLQRVRVR